MTTGEKIQKLRREMGWSQDDLASKLEVSRQAVYKWESDLTLPEKDKLDKIVKLFNTSYNYLMDNSVDEEVKQKESSSEEKKEKLVQEEKIVIGRCDGCGRTIYKGELLLISKESHRVGRQTITKSKTLCESCYKIRMEQKKAFADSVQKDINKNANRKRIFGWVFGGLAFILILVLTIVFTVKNNGNPMYILYGGIGAILAFTLIGCLFLHNNCVMDVIETIVDWGVVKFPGVIFSFDLDGLKFLIIIKVIFGIIGFILIFLALILALVIGGVVSLFVYPFALRKSFKHPDSVEC